MEDFKKLSNQKIMEEYGFNDTSRWIIEYSKGKGFSKGIIIGTGALSLFLGGNMYAVGISSINKYDAFPYQFSFLFGTTLVVSGVWLEVYGIKMKDAKTEIYNNLKQYYTTHNVSKKMAKYIQYKREHYKPKPFLN
ncbi:MAG: hypothetical protein ACEQSR_11005 [Candidatus Methylacidiphilales bacterium]